VTHEAYDSSDLRVQRTRRLIQDALIELTIQKGFAAVTVRDITRYAGVNRATFYRHYQDKFDLLDQYAREVYGLLDSSLGDSAEDSPDGLTKMFEHIHAHARFYRVKLSQNGDPAFGERIRRYIDKRLRSVLPAAQRSQPLTELYLSFIVSGSVGVFGWWLEHSMPYTPAEMATISQQLASVILNNPR